VRRRRQSNLGLLPTALIGRDDEVAVACERLSGGGTRLVTFTGPPGVGKTSLALTVAHELASRFRHGAWVVDLAPIEDAAGVAAAIAEGLGVLRSGDRLPFESTIRFLHDRRLLLMLDNFEQVVAAAPEVAELLAACPGLTIIVTSRVPLRVRGEWELSVGPLRLPDLAHETDLDVLAQVPAVVLFVERSRAVSRSFGLAADNARLIGEICVALDGLPLAIELAAARVRTLSPRAMHARLVGSGMRLGVGPDPSGRPAAPGGADASPLAWLTDGPRDLPVRQQSLREAIAWSYDLLEPAEQMLLRRLGVFVGGCTFEAAATVCDGSWERITALVEHSLVRYEQPSSRVAEGGEAEPRLRLLETVRQYAIERLTSSGEWDVLRGRHAAFFVDLAEQAEPELAGPGQAVWLERLGQDHENLRATARWATTVGDVESVLRLGAALIRFWRARGEAADAGERIQAILALATAAPPISAAVKAFYGAGDLALLVGDFPAAQTLFTESLHIARQLADQTGVARALRALCKLAGHRGSYAEAQHLGEESLAILEAHGDLEGLATTLCQLGMSSYLADDQARARRLFERSRAVAHQIGDLRLMSQTAFGLALTHHLEGGYAEARRLYEESLAIDRDMGHRSSEGSALNNLGHLAILRGEPGQARALLCESLRASRDGGDRRRLGFTLSAVAGLVAIEGDPERAIRLDAAGRAALQTMGARLAPAMRDLYDSPLAPARQAIGEESVVAAEAAGRGLVLDRAVDEALAWLFQDLVEDGARRAQPEVPGSASVEASVEAPGTAVAVPVSGSLDASVRRPSASVLTRRERDVALLLGNGRTTNREIAAALIITEGTAANYVQRVLTRLDLRTRAQVAAWAVEYLSGEAPAVR
jgi:predicted ATPase/DNA-binding CsgD family transcriptional regulator/Flp pilus assembly protein TadD